jgi:hypothetical protein
MKDYKMFKDLVIEILAMLKSDGVEIVAKKWAKISRYQKNRYKPEYCYPEVWLYRKDHSLGFVLTGEELLTYFNEGGHDEVKKVIIDCLY